MDNEESFVVVEPKLETEHEGDVSVSGDEDWSDTDLGPPTPHPHVSQGEAATQTFTATPPFGTTNLFYFF